MAGGYFHYESDSSVPSSSSDRSLACSPATSLMNHPIGHAGARGASLDLSPSSTRSGGTGMMRDPFVDPRLSLDSWSRSSIESSNAYAATTHSRPTNGESDHYYADSSDRSERPGMRPAMGRSNSDVQRELQDALQDGLPTPKKEEKSTSSAFASRIMMASGESKKSGTSTSSAGSTHSGSTSGGGGFLSQFRTGSGWFAPVVPPEPKLTRAEREQLEKERIEELRNSGANASRKRPSFMKRMSSGVEMMGSFGKDPSGLSPAKQGRARSGTATTITEAYRG
ncbi:BZ3500_MvSof-1268-A1-R1_Chr3-2g06288 [Microbotryum saponariae]|uniref:BZ3500_MvSof-1268-A1-R1_Chr3-2g06288 protein n=1 Tax=Microbotryum saponariae TaxID=289078 RepID=A0A2X0LEQ3_9BASI|nr:BZ3500_MvSof-1268-A1-R1_Chr3-2g06288 [Microbotryum saponariae]SDA04259.1 BZ3501_MvSof-1269-A2-R1_Chr3-2g05979 [Microbotryum saponariae]